ncbi:MAG: hypothetical protein Q4D32_08550, partial [Eubacteriales bacterium]|nr:hypothetical protein [Eubacteriales bacterium]
NLFYNEFIKEKYIAVGWNWIRKRDLTQGMPEEQAAYLKSQIEKEYKEKVPGTVLNKCLRFCFELKENDIVVIIGEKKITIAYIKKYYEADEKVYTVELEKKMNSDTENLMDFNEKYFCPYLKRRKIEVIKEIDKKDLSIHLSNAIGVNRHSLSNLNEYAEHILCESFPWYYYDNKITFSMKIRRKKDINAVDFSEFVLASAQILGNGNKESVSIKTTINSPGNVLIQIAEGLMDNPLLLPTIYIAIFGGKVRGIEFHSLISIIKDFINKKH